MIPASSPGPLTRVLFGHFHIVEIDFGIGVRVAHAHFLEGFAERQARGVRGHIDQGDALVARLGVGGADDAIGNVGHAGAAGPDFMAVDDPVVAGRLGNGADGAAVQGGVFGIGAARRFGQGHAAAVGAVVTDPGHEFHQQILAAGDHCGRHDPVDDGHVRGDARIAPGDLFDDHVVDAAADGEPAHRFGPVGLLYSDIHQALVDCFEGLFGQLLVAMPAAFQVLPAGGGSRPSTNSLTACNIRIIRVACIHGAEVLFP